MLLLFLPSLASAEFLIQNWQGESVELVFESKVLPIERAIKLKTGSFIKTGAKALVRIESDSEEGAWLLQSESMLEVTRHGVMLKEGALRIVSAKAAMTPVSEHFLKSKSGDALVEYWQLYGKSRLTTYKGQFETRLFGQDRGELSAAGFQVEALAEVDEEGPVVHIFLGGKRQIVGKVTKPVAHKESAKGFLAHWKPPAPAPPPSAGPGEICEKPYAQYNQCLWTCVGQGGSKGACDVSRAGVYCQRKRCNANGEWEEATRLPASLGYRCSAKGPSMAPCDY